LVVRSQTRSTSMVRGKWFSCLASTGMADGVWRWSATLIEFVGGPLDGVALPVPDEQPTVPCDDDQYEGSSEDRVRRRKKRPAPAPGRV
jgi:hypothetical protein